MRRRRINSLSRLFFKMQNLIEDSNLMTYHLPIITDMSMLEYR